MLLTIVDYICAILDQGNAQYLHKSSTRDPRKTWRWKWCSRVPHDFPKHSINSIVTIVTNFRATIYSVDRIHDVLKASALLNGRRSLAVASRHGGHADALHRRQEDDHCNECMLCDANALTQYTNKSIHVDYEYSSVKRWSLKGIELHSGAVFVIVGRTINSPRIARLLCHA